MTRTDLYYVVAEPQNKGTFRPIVLEYGIDLIHAEKVVRKHINDNGLRYKIGDKKYPAFIRISSMVFSILISSSTHKISISAI